MKRKRKQKFLIFHFQTKLRNCENNNLNDLVHRIMHTKEREDVSEKSFQLMITDIYMKTMMILKPPFLCRTIVMCLIACFVTSSYYTLTLWLPELFHRYADFQEAYPNQTASVCTLKSAKNVTEIVSDRITNINMIFRRSLEEFFNISYISRS